MPQRVLDVTWDAGLLPVGDQPFRRPTGDTVKIRVAMTVDNGRVDFFGCRSPVDIETVRATLAQDVVLPKAKTIVRPFFGLPLEWTDVIQVRISEAAETKILVSCATNSLLVQTEAGIRVAERGVVIEWAVSGTKGKTWFVLAPLASSFPTWTMMPAPRILPAAARGVASGSNLKIDLAPGPVPTEATEKWIAGVPQVIQLVWLERFMD